MIYLIIWFSTILSHLGIVLVKNRSQPILVSEKIFVDLTLMVVFVYGFWSSPVAFRNLDARYGLVILLGILSTYAGLHFGPRQGYLVRFRQLNVNLPTRWLQRLTVVYIIMLAMPVIDRLRLGYPLFVSGRTLDYLDGGILSGSLLITYLRTPLVIPFWLLLERYVDRKQFVSAGLLYLCVGLLIAAPGIGNRYVWIAYFFVPIAYFYKNHRKLGTAVFLLLPIIGLALMTILNVWRHLGFNAIGEFSYSFSTIIRQFDRDLAPLESFDLLYQMDRLGILRYDMGYQYLLTLMTFVPRTLWAAKPITAFEPRYTEIIYGGTIGSGISVATFTAWGEGIAMFGLWGLFLHAFLFGLACRLIGVVLNHARGTWLAFAYMCIYIPTWFRSSLTSYLFWLAFSLGSYYLLVNYAHLLTRRLSFRNTKAQSGKFGTIPVMKG